MEELNIAVIAAAAKKERVALRPGPFDGGRCDVFMQRKPDLFSACRKTLSASILSASARCSPICCPRDPASCFLFYFATVLLAALIFPCPLYGVLFFCLRCLTEPALSAALQTGSTWSLDINDKRRDARFAQSWKKRKKRKKGSSTGYACDSLSSRVDGAWPL